MIRPVLAQEVRSLRKEGGASLPTHPNHWLPHQPESEKLHPACHTAVRHKHKALKGRNAGSGQLEAFKGNFQGYRDLTIKEQFLSGTRPSQVWKTGPQQVSTMFSTTLMDSPRPLYLLDLVHKALRLLHCDILHREFQGSHTSLVCIKNLKRRSSYLCNTCQNTDNHIPSPKLTSGFLWPPKANEFTLHSEKLNFPIGKGTQPHPGRTQDSFKQ